MRNIFCYAPQAPAVQHFFEGLGPMRLIGVHRAEQVMGLENATFINVCGHPNQIPSEIYQSLRIYGAVLWNIDDAWLRDRYNERQRGKHR